MPVSPVTTSRSYPVPGEGNDLNYDFPRLVTALEMIDADVAALLVELATKITAASPAFTGTPTAPTATLGDSSTKIATTAFVAAALSNLISANPSLSDLETVLAGKASTGDIATLTSALLGKADAAATTSALAAKAAAADVLLKNGSVALTGPMSFGDQAITNVASINGRAPGPVALAAINANSGTSAVLTGIPSWATMIVVDLHAISLSDTSSLFLQLGDSGGLEASGYVGGLGQISSSVAGYNPATGGAPIFVVGAARTISATFTISKVEGNRWNISGIAHITDASTPIIDYIFSTKELSATLDRVGLFVNGAGVFDGTGRMSGKYW